MIEKFLEKFLPQITERLNENEEVGKALIEALAVLDNYATINNVQFTDEQVNNMLGIVPEPAPEPNADIPAEIVEIVEKKKRGRKPKTTWSWRFKTAQEFEQEYGEEWYGGIAGTDVNWGVDMDEFNMAFLEGQPIKMSKESEALLNRLFTSDTDFLVNVGKEFGIKNPSLSGAKKFTIIKEMLTDKPLPTAAAPTTWSWRFKTEDEFVNEFGTDWAKQISWNTSDMNYLLGEEITKTTESEEAIEELTARTSSKLLNTFNLGIDSGGDNTWRINTDMLTDKPLPKVILRRGQPLTQPTNTAWNWRFKTEQELQQEWGLNRWKNKVAWANSGKMNYLLGKPIIESDLSKQFIEDLLKSSEVSVDTNNNLGIDSGSRNIWTIREELVTNKPLPTAAAPAKSEPKKRGRKPKSKLPEIDLGGLEDIGDIDIDDIDFDNLVI